MRARTLATFVLSAALLPLALSCGDAGGSPTGPAPSPGAPETKIQLMGGGSQVGAPGRALERPVTIAVKDAQNRPVAGVALSFVVVSGGGAVTPEQGTTDAAGEAQAVWTLGSAPGEQELKVSGPGGELMVQAVADASGPSTPSAVASVRVEPDSLALQAGDSARVIAVALNAGGHEITGLPVTWTTSDGEVAPVSAAGMVYGGTAGTAQVTATVAGISGSAHVRVAAAPPTEPVVAKVRIEPDSLALLVGDSARVIAVALDAGGTPITGLPVGWTSSAEGVASIGAGGMVRGIAAGTAEVTATVAGITASIRVRVADPPPPAVATVRIEPDSLALLVGDSARVIAVALDAGGTPITGLPVGWTSSASAVASVGTGGMVRGVAAGSATVTATVAGVSGSATVRVTAPPPARAPVASVEILPDSLVLDPDHAHRVTASAYDAQGNVLTGRAVAWSSSDTTIAPVDADGTVRARSAGTARITATVEGVTASISVRVRSRAVARVLVVRVMPDSLELPPGGSGDLDAAAYDGEGGLMTGRPVAWSSSDTTIATVNEYGFVRAVRDGRAIVTATVDGVEGTAVVRVRTRDPQRAVRIHVSPDSLVMLPGKLDGFNGWAEDAAGNQIIGRPIVWTSSDTTIAKAEVHGVIYSRRAGTVTVTATLDGVSATAKVIVRDPPPPPPVTVTQVQVRVGGAGGFIDVAQYAKELNFWVHTNTRVDGITMRIRGPDGTLLNCVGSNATSYYYNEFLCSLEMPRGAAPGLWTVDRVTVMRSDGTFTFDADDLAEMGTSGRMFDVFNAAAADTRPPLFRTSVPFGRSEEEPGMYWMRIGLMDHASGVQSTSLTVRGPNGERVTASCHPGDSLPAQHTDWYCKLPLPAGSGTWRVESFTARDGAGNAVTETREQMERWRGVFELTFLQFEFQP